jgi:hypothetical protein
MNLIVGLQGGSLPSPSTWRVVSGMPSWMTMNRLSDASAQISGVPTAGGTHNIKLEVTGASCKVTGTVTIKVYAPLEELVKPYIKGTATLKVANPGVTIKGGKPPYICSMFRGTGQGTVPAGVLVDTNDVTGCTLKGLPNNTNAAGSYGFLMNVEDSLGAQIQVPIVYKHGSCSPTTNRVTITPPIGNTPVFKAGAAYSFKVQLSDVGYNQVTCGSTADCRTSTQDPNSICNGGICQTSGGGTYCGYETISITLFLGPLTAGQGLSCATTAPVCMDCNGQTACLIGNRNACPLKHVLEQNITVRAHTTIRPNKAPAFQTLEPRYIFPNNSARNTSCHFEVLERD